MKIQLPTESNAPPLSACPLVHPRAILAPTPISTPPPAAAYMRSPAPTPAPRSVSRRTRPASHADVKPPSITPASSKTSQSCSGLATPFGRYGASAGDAAARTGPCTAAVPDATTLANAPEAPSPCPTTTYAASRTRPMPMPARYGSMYGRGGFMSRPFSTRLLFDRASTVDGPVLERAVIQEHRMTEQPRGKDHRGRLLADMAIRDDRIAVLDTRLLEQRFDARPIDPQLVVGHLRERDVHCARNMAREVVHRRLDAC